MTTAVTGASGHLGAAVVRTLLGDGASVRAVDLQRGPGLAGLDVEFVTADVLDLASLRSAFDDVSVVYHLAARISVTGDPEGKVWATNVEGVRNATAAATAADVGRFVHCSSVHAYDLERVVGVLDEAGPRAENRGLPVYDRSKWAGESAIAEAVQTGLDAVVVNPTGILGPLDFGPSRMGRFFLNLRRRRIPALVEGAFDWVDVRDVAAGMRAAERDGSTGENYLLSGHLRSVSDLADTAASITGVTPPRTLPMWLARLWGPLGTVLTRRRRGGLEFTSESLHALAYPPRIDRSKAETKLGFQPRPLEETVGDIYDWFDGQGMS